MSFVSYGQSIIVLINSIISGNFQSNPCRPFADRRERQRVRQEGSMEGAPSVLSVYLVTEGRRDSAEDREDREAHSQNHIKLKKRKKTSSDY